MSLNAKSHEAFSQALREYIDVVLSSIVVPTYGKSSWKKPDSEEINRYILSNGTYVHQLTNMLKE